MNIDALTTWIEITLAALALIAGLVGGLWAYVRFILERGLFPPCQFDIDSRTVGTQRDETILEIVLHLKNHGSATLVPDNIRVDVLYLGEHDEPKLFHNPEDPNFGRLYFPRSLRKRLGYNCGSSTLASAQPSSAEETNRVRQCKGSAPGHDPNRTREDRGIQLLRGHTTFVQAGVEQLYPFTTTVPKATTFVSVWGSFRYALETPSSSQRGIFRLSRWLGLVQYTLNDVSKPHTAERVFNVALDPA